MGQIVGVLAVVAYVIFQFLRVVTFNRDHDPNVSALQSELFTIVGPTIVLGVALAFLLLKHFADVIRKELARRAKQQAAPSAAYAMREDDRPAILLLRSFADDIAMNGEHRFEETIAPPLMQFGPLVAIGDPKDELPDLGAYRDYVDETMWQERVRSYIRQVEFIVMIPGNSEWIRWELAEILAGDFLHKTIFILPPRQSLSDKTARLKSTWSAFLGRADLTPVQLAGVAETIAIHFFEPDTITCLVDSSIATAKSYDYGTALLAAFREPAWTVRHQRL